MVFHMSTLPERSQGLEVHLSRNLSSLSGAKPQCLVSVSSEPTPQNIYAASVAALTDSFFPLSGTGFEGNK